MVQAHDLNLQQTHKGLTYVSLLQRVESVCVAHLTLDAEVGAEELEVGEERQQVRQNHHGLNHNKDIMRKKDPHRQPMLTHVLTL